MWCRHHAAFSFQVFQFGPPSWLVPFCVPFLQLCGFLLAPPKCPKTHQVNNFKLAVREFFRVGLLMDWHLVAPLIIGISWIHFKENGKIDNQIFFLILSLRAITILILTLTYMLTKEANTLMLYDYTLISCFLLRLFSTLTVM